MRWYLTLLLAAALLPPAVLAAMGPSISLATATAWSVSLLVSIVLGLAVVRVLERRLAGPSATLTLAAQAIGRGEAPRLRPLPVVELDEAARALEAAGAARQGAERRLRAREARLAAVLDAADAAVLVVDGAGVVVLFNRAAEVLLRCPAAEAIGTPADRFFSRGLGRLVSAQLEGRMATAPAFGEGPDLTAVRRGGGEFPVEVAISGIELGGDRLCTLILRDVTDRARQDAERLLRLETEQAARAEAEDAARRSGLLAESARMLTSSLDRDVVLAGIARLVAGAIADWCVIDRVEDGGEVRRVAVAHADAGRDEAARALCETYPAAVDDPETVWPVLSSGEPALVAEVTDGELERRARSGEHLRILKSLGLRSYMVVPFVARGRTLGAMTLVRAAGAPYTLTDMAAARELADRVAIALDNAELLRTAQGAHARFAGLVDGLDAIVWEADPTTLAFTFVSQRAESLLGYPLTRWLEDREFLVSLLHPDDREAALECFLASSAGEDCRAEHRAIAADGRVLWLDSIVRAERDDAGAVRRLHGLMIDVTERRRFQEERDHLLAREQAARAEAEAAERRARLLAEASEMLASSLDYDATLHAVARLAVPTFADWCLAHMTDDAGTRVYAASADPEGASVIEALERVIPTLDPADVNPLLGLFASGEALVPEVAPAWLEALRLVQRLSPTSMMTVPLTARGRPLGSLVFVSARPERRYGAADLALARDLAQRAAVAVDNARLFREAERANRAKDEFVATLSHELRTPLGAMLGWVQMLRSRRLAGDEAERALESIERNTRLQGRLIHDLLDVSRIVAGKLTLDRRPLDLRPVIEQAVEMVRREARAKALTVDWSAEPVAHRVLGDAVRLEQVALNLLSNAVKFTPAGGRIEARLDRLAGWARLAVTDTGEGIEAGALPHVFEIFHQADSTTTRRHGGLGLGLAIVRHIVDLHGGRVEASSPGRGRGAIFTVLLPMLADAPQDAAPPPPPRLEPARLEQPRLDGVHVLVVDDHEESRQFVKAVLSGCGAEVSLAGSADEALDMLHSLYVDVLVSDIGMPGSDGYDLIRRLREREREHGGRIPAIALTAYAGADDRARAIAAGFQHYITKPVGPDELAEVVARAAGRAPVS
jgi:PAS domain S-box-containing protein